MTKAFTLALLLLSALLVGCSNGPSSNSGGGGGGGVKVLVSPNSGVTVGVTLTQQFTATVSGSSNTAVNWSVSGAGCSGAGCGSISPTGLFTAPSIVPNPAAVTIVATSVADATKSAKASVQIVNVTVAVAPKIVTVALTGTQQFVASVTPSGISQAITWSLSCAGTPCGAVDQNGLYTAPTSLPSPATVTVTATSASVSTASDHATVTLVTSFSNRLTGTYAFHFSGFDATGQVLAAGNFVADGNGNISAGTEDISRASGPQTLAITGGTYTVGSDNRGTLNLITSLGTSIYKFAIGSSGETLFVEFDGTGTTGSGVLDLASTSSFRNNSFSTPFAFGLSGADAAGKRAGYVGLIVPDGAGNISSGSLDVNDNGVASNSSNVTGTYSVALSGRGTMALSVAGAAVNFAFYMVHSNEIFFISTDPTATNPRVIGLAVGQVAQSFTNSTLKGNSIFYLTGTDATGGFSNAVIGLSTGDGNGNSSGVFDENNAGAITSNTGFTGSYNSTGGGRYTATLFGSPVVIYAIAANQGFVQDQTASVLTGRIQPQKSMTYSPATIQGTFVAGTLTVSDLAAQNLAAALALNAGLGLVSGTQDETDGGQNAGQTLTGAYTVAANGRGAFTLTSPLGAPNRVLYVVNNSQFVVMGVDSTDKNATIVVAQR